MGREEERRVASAGRDESAAERASDLDTVGLVAEAQAGGMDAFEALYRRYFGRVYAYLRIALDDMHEAEDATQQVFVKVMEAIGGYERRSQPFRAWLFTIARNHAIDLLKASGKFELMEPLALDELRENAVDDEADAAILEWITDVDLTIFIERLPVVQRQVLALRFLMGMDTKEIAREIGRTESDIRVLQSRALRFLRARLAAIGRGPVVEVDGADRGDRAGIQRRFRQAPVLRMRRYALGEKPDPPKRRW